MNVLAQRGVQPRDERGRFAPLRSVAVRVGDLVFEGEAGDIHATLIGRLLLERVISEEDARRIVEHYDEYMGFVTEGGKYISREDARRIIGAFTSEEARSMGLLKAGGWVAKRLPVALQGARAFYGFGSKNYELRFASDEDMALYIVAGKRPRRYKQWMAYLRSRLPGYTDKQILALGEQVRFMVRRLAEVGGGGVIDVPAFYSRELAMKNVLEKSRQRLGVSFLKPQPQTSPCPQPLRFSVACESR